MKIVGVSNHDSETDSDVLVCENVNEHYVAQLVEALNAKVTDRSPTFYKAVADDYVLYVWEP